MLFRDTLFVFQDPLVAAVSCHLTRVFTVEKESQGSNVSQRCAQEDPEYLRWNSIKHRFGVSYRHHMTVHCA